jgi:hypothetical protein
MSLLHIGVALGLSAAAAFLVTGAAMQPIKPDVAAACTVGSQTVIAGPSCLSAADEQPVGNTSGIRLDAGRRAYGH